MDTLVQVRSIMYRDTKLNCCRLGLHGYTEVKTPVTRLSRMQLRPYKVP